MKTEQANYQELIVELNQLKIMVKELETENARLRERLGEDNSAQSSIPPVSLNLSLQEKIDLFRSLFKGREDVFARRWYSQTTGKTGYQPVCGNEWNTLLCDKKKYKCSDCPNRRFSPLTDTDFYKHLSGKDEDCRDVIGLYAILDDDTCHFLCTDFDDKNCDHGYQNDVSAFTNVCKKWEIPYAVERSRSGKGAHVWIFFDNPVPAVKARKLGNAILTEAMNQNGCISFKSYDRFIPNQDFLPEGGFGNLIALPLQGKARKMGNSVFVNDDFLPFNDQWAYLHDIRKYSEPLIDNILTKFADPMPMGDFSKTSEAKPWEAPIAPTITKADFDRAITIIKSNRLFIPLKDVKAKVLNHLKRIASFKNPEFYSRQAMRFSTFSTPRIISCAEIMDDYLALPRGCESAIRDFLSEKGVQATWMDKTNHGCPISVTFNGLLREDQATAIDTLSTETNGVLSATTAFGKTVAAIGLIAKLKINTLILVHTKALLDQWKRELEKFLIIDYNQENEPLRPGRKKKFSPIGTLCSTGDSRHGIVDVAIMQSCICDNEVKPFVKDYGSVIVDECHHVSAVSFEQILKTVCAQRVYGLTATPIRKDGNQPIIFMQCGPIRYSADAKTQMQNQSFQRLLVPRFTSYRSLTEDKQTYTQTIQLLAEDEKRNQLIVNDICETLKESRSPIVLTNLTSHVAILAEHLKPHCPNVITLVGSESAKEKRQKQEMLLSLPSTAPLVIIATGKYVGEGFDFPRLDTLFLSLPVSWKGIIAQYAGRLHREYEGKKEVLIYDYVDINVPVCDVMYRRRLKGYASIGYCIRTNEVFFSEQIPSTDIIYDGKTFCRPFLASLCQAKKSIILCCPKIKLSKYSVIADRLRNLPPMGIRITIFTKEENEDTLRLCSYGIHLSIKKDINFNCCIIDKSIVWYGSVNLLGFQSVEDNMITFQNADTANNLIEMLIK